MGPNPLPLIGLTRLLVLSVAVRHRPLAPGTGHGRPSLGCSLAWLCSKAASLYRQGYFVSDPVCSYPGSVHRWRGRLTGTAHGTGGATWARLEPAPQSLVQPSPAGSSIAPSDPGSRGRGTKTGRLGEDGKSPGEDTVLCICPPSEPAEFRVARGSTRQCLYPPACPFARASRFSPKWESLRA